MSDEMLYERHFERMERNRWMLTRDVPWEQLQPELLPDGLLYDLRYICLTELSALYATEMFIRDFYEDIDFSAFVSVWFYEEMKHFLTMKKYINKCGLHLPDLETELPKLRLSFDPGPAVQTMTMHFIGEHRLALWYNNFADTFQEPVLKKIFRILATDELRHGAVYMTYLDKAAGKDENVLREVLMMSLWMLRSSSDKPKHPTTVTKPSVLDMLEDPDYLTRMINTYTPVSYDETEMKETVFANLSRFAGRSIKSEREILHVLRDLKEPDREMVGSRPL
ncbi:MAG: ferritin-like domain-containing protein [Candidatus Dormibacteria bacterium]